MTMLTPNLVARIAAAPARLAAGGPARAARYFGHDGVAVTLNTNSFAHCRLAAASFAIGALVAVALGAASAGMALAQTGQPPAAAPAAPAASPAAPVVPSAPAPPSPGVLTLPPQPPPVAPLAAAPAEKPGFFGAFGQWWDQSMADFKTKMKDQQTKMDEFNKQSADAAKDAATATGQAMKSAADAMTHLTHVVEVQETCPLAGNGAADCAVAATNVCKGKGYNTGQPLDVRTAEKCADSLWVSGQPPAAAADCPVETVLLRAACQ